MSFAYLVAALNALMWSELLVCPAVTGGVTIGTRCKQARGCRCCEILRPEDLVVGVGLLSKQWVWNKGAGKHVVCMTCKIIRYLLVDRVAV